MSGALYSSTNYAQAISALLPRGRVWPNDPGSDQQQVIGQLALTPERLDAAAQQLLVDAFPGSTVNLIAEWEASLGLVSADVGFTPAQRQAAVLAKLITVGGQSALDFIAFAAALGFTITITTYAPFRCGVGRCGQPLQGPSWSFAWSVSVQANTGVMTPAQLLAELQTVAPAESAVFLT